MHRDTGVGISVFSVSVKEHGLGGAMFWEASSDKGGAESLILTARDSLGSLEDKRNWLNYPGSVYDNIRTGSV